MGGFECFIVLVIVAAVLAVAWHNRAHNRDVSQAFATVARWFHGRIERASYFASPVVRIPYNHTELELSTSVAENGRRCTEVAMDWPEFDTHVRILSQSMSQKWMGGPQGKVKLGEPEFERQFVVTSDDANAARTLVTGGVRSAAVMLSRIHGGAIDVRFGGGRLLVQKLSVLDQASELSALVRHAMELFDQAMLSRTVGIEFVEQLQLQSIDDAKCPVCCDDIAEDLVFCGRCKTPHHRECWIYSGKCSTYGCGETQFVVPKVAKPR